ncbi:YciI family protein [Cellulophaga lytica]|uniref:YciI family protein n=1 Tax=Cellulophaga lytica TaxID=979 RepID=UPI000B5C3AC2|nr:YciI family protein [Cellulophaga lytica]SNQ42198.1 YCII-related protein [Cellulophaga lytica]
MKDFMLIFIGKEYTDLGLSPEQMQERMGKWFAWNQKMQKEGVVKHGEALHPEVRQISGPNRTVTDRTAAELKEIVGGYYVVKANDLDHACKIAQDFPDYDLGNTVEVREVLVFDEM